MKVLYLSEWYPHRYDAMSGLFVRKHAAAAVRAGVEVCVLYFLKDEKLNSGKESERGSYACEGCKDGMEVVDQTTDGVREIYVYYSGSWLRAMHKGWNEVKNRWGMPDLTQLNVLTKNGLLAYRLKQKEGIPYILVEHWSGYLPENNSFKGGLKGWMMKKIASQASVIAPVSEALEKGMKACGIKNANWTRIHNVVDDFFYHTEQEDNDCAVGKGIEKSSIFEEKDKNESSLQKAEKEADKRFRFLHVSCFDERAKNVNGILEATKKLATERTDFELVIIGTGVDFEAAKKTSDRLGLTDNFVYFRGERKPEEVQQAMQESDCFVLFSRYETAGVVLAECLASGLPMIGTRAGAIAEVINERNGLLIKSEDTDALKAAMSRMIETAEQYDKAAIREMGKAYSEEAVGQTLKDIYASVLS